MEKISNYQLINEEDNSLRFAGSYTKYYPNSPYCAIFEEYPVARTKVLVCKRIGDQEKSYGSHRCHLMRQQGRSSPADIGTYIVLCEVSSEEEATKAVESNMRGMEELLRIFQGR